MSAPSSPSHADEAPLLIVAATEMELRDLLVETRESRAIDGSAWPVAWTGRLRRRPVALVACGVGKASAASAVAWFAATLRPSACLMTGIAGAYVGAFVPVGSAVCAASETDLDAGVAYTDTITSLAEIPLPRVPASGRSYEDLDRGGDRGGDLFEVFPTDPGWTSALSGACGTVPVPFATSDAIAGDLDVAASRAARSGAAIESMEGAGAALACARLGLPFAQVRGVSNVAGVRDKAAWNVGSAVRAGSSALLAALGRPTVPLE
ncbi:MAG: futalosine hydrolase [Trueperaceae bacterium]|nr:futalosine hydrolase [Trueperaceae bacterium]